MFARSFLRLVNKGTRSGIILVNALTNLSSLPDPLVEQVCGLDHLGGVEYQVDVVVLRLERAMATCILHLGDIISADDFMHLKYAR